MSSHLCGVVVLVFLFFKQKTAYEMRISDWSSDVCSSDLGQRFALHILDDGRSAPMDMARLQQRFEQCPVRVGGREHHLAHLVKIGRASCRERVCQYV